ncbi:MAG: methylmalonyl-CoA mutase family protein [Planctomycetota bacterium]
MATEFDPVSYEDWRRGVEQELKGADFERTLCRVTAEGLVRQPLYTEAELLSSAAPGQPPYLRGSAQGTEKKPWKICQRYAEFGPRRLNAAMRFDQEGGSDAFFFASDYWVRCGEAPRDDGAGPAARGVGLYTTDDFEIAFEGVDLNGDTTLVFEPGANALPLATLICAYAGERGLDPVELNVRFGADPLGALGLDGCLPVDLGASYRETATLAKLSQKRWPKSHSIRVSSRSYFEAGAHSVQELGALTATLVENLRRLEKLGLTIEEIAAETELALSLGNDVFGGIAKLRAARWLWSRVLKACGVENPPPPFLHAESARRGLAKVDPWVNILRVSGCTFAAILGGANSITARTFDGQIQDPSELGRRIARNTQHILAEECGLGEVIDPAGGSFYLESWTLKLARAAWDFFLKIEARGGMSEAILQGFIREQIEESATQRKEAVASRKKPLTGVSEFPPQEEARAAEENRTFEPRPSERHNIREAARQEILAADENSKSGPDLKPDFDGLVQLAQQGANLFELGHAIRGSKPALKLAPGLTLERDAEVFEQLRVRAREVDATPSVFVINLGALREHNARTQFATDFFAVAGLQVNLSPSFVTDDPKDLLKSVAAEFVKTPSPVVCLCANDETYADAAAPVVAALRTSGVTKVYCCGRPNAALGRFAAASAVEFLGRGVDIVATLGDVLDQFNAAEETEA